MDTHFKYADLYYLNPTTQRIYQDYGRDPPLLRLSIVDCGSGLPQRARAAENELVFSVECNIKRIFFIELTMTRVNRFTTVSSTLVRRAVANPTRQTALA